jgi:hypothetical protein
MLIEDVLFAIHARWEKGSVILISARRKQNGQEARKQSGN